MKLEDAGELSLLSLLEKQFRYRNRNVICGIGDDTAIVRNLSAASLLTTDMMVENVHFDLAWTTPFQIGYKLVSRNVSDIYAMGGTPDFLLLNFASPKELDMSFFARFFQGVAAALRKYRCALVGGDISRSETITVSATVAGHADHPIYRKGARRGDFIHVSGTLGDAAGGMAILKTVRRPVEIERGRKVRLPVGWECGLPLVRRHLMPDVRPTKRFSGVASAMIDISDGLLIDLSRLCTASRVGARIFLENLPVSSQLRTTADVMGFDPYDCALSGGDDYEVLFTSSAERVRGASMIGEIVTRGLVVVDATGAQRTARCRGYQHFAV